MPSLFASDRSTGCLKSVGSKFQHSGPQRRYGNRLLANTENPALLGVVELRAASGDTVGAQPDAGDEKAPQIQRFAGREMAGQAGQLTNRSNLRGSLLFWGRSDLPPGAVRGGLEGR